MLSNSFIQEPHQLDPRGQNLDYLCPQYKVFSSDTNIAQKQSLKKHDFKTDLDKVKFDFAYKKAMTQDIYPSKIDYHFYKTNKDEYVGGAQKDENIHARQMRLLRIQADNFEKGEANKLKDLSDTVPFTEARGTFIQILQNLAEIKSNVSPGESLKEVKPERLNEILGKTMNSGINFNKKQLNQLRQVVESILDNSINQRVIQNKPKFLTMFKIYAMVVHLLATVNTQDNEIRKRKLDAFVDNVLDQSAKVIAENLTNNYRSIVDLKLADLVEKAKAVDKVPGKDKQTKVTFKEDKDQLKDLLKQGDREALKKASDKDIKKLTVPELKEVANDLGIVYDPKIKKDDLIKKIKDKIQDDNDDDDKFATARQERPTTQIPQTPQGVRQIDFDNDDMPPLETDEQEKERKGEGRKRKGGKSKHKIKNKKVSGGFYPQARSLLRLLK